MPPPRPTHDVASQTLRRHLFKTKMCPHLAAGFCSRPTGCCYAHTYAELRAFPDLRRSKLCGSIKRGEVCRDSRCEFAHVAEELNSRSYSDTFKMRICFYWRKGKCLNGRFCRFAHGSDELRPENYRNPTPEVPRPFHEVVKLERSYPRPPNEQNPLLLPVTPRNGRTLFVPPPSPRDKWMPSRSNRKPGTYRNHGTRSSSSVYPRDTISSTSSTFYPSRDHDCTYTPSSSYLDQGHSYTPSTSYRSTPSTFQESYRPTPSMSFQDPRTSYEDQLGYRNQETSYSSFYRRDTISSTPSTSYNGTTYYYPPESPRLPSTPSSSLRGHDSSTPLSYQDTTTSSCPNFDMDIDIDFDTDPLDRLIYLLETLALQDSEN